MFSLYDAHKMFAGDDQYIMNILVTDERNKENLMGLESYWGFRGKGCVWRANWFYFISYFTPRGVSKEADASRLGCIKNGVKISLSEDWPVHICLDDVIL